MEHPWEENQNFGRGQIENIENYKDFHITNLMRLYITLTLFMLNFDSPEK